MLGMDGRQIEAIVIISLFFPVLFFFFFPSTHCCPLARRPERVPFFFFFPFLAPLLLPSILSLNFPLAYYLVSQPQRLSQ